MESLTRNELVALLRYHAEYSFGPDPDRIAEICRALKSASDKLEDIGNTARFPVKTRSF